MNRTFCSSISLFIFFHLFIKDILSRLIHSSLVASTQCESYHLGRRKSIEGSAENFFRSKLQYTRRNILFPKQTGVAIGSSISVKPTYRGEYP